MPTPNESDRTRKSRATRVGLALGSFALAALLLELGARFHLGDEFLNGPPMGRPREACAVHDPDLGWVNKPGVRTRIEAPKQSYRVEINGQGLRDREHAYEKPAGVYRIVLLGDSLAWGWGVDNGFAYADLVEAALGPKVEVVNLGVPGYSNDQHLWILQREGRRYDPDLVLLGFVLNDVVGNDGVRTDDLAKPRYARGADGEWILENHPVPRAEGAPDPRASFEEWLWSHSACMQLLRPADSEVQLATAGRAVIERHSRDAAEFSLVALKKEKAVMLALADEIADAESVTFMLLTRLERACGELGAPLIAFAIAHHHDRFLYSPKFPRPPLPEGEFRTVLTERLTEAGELIGFATFSVDQAMLDETLAGVLLCTGDGHLNERGNEVVAERIVEELGPVVRSTSE